MLQDAFPSRFEPEGKVSRRTEPYRMNEPAANKLLKTLEEPPARTHFVLLSESPDELLPTVRSRCQRIDFAALSDTAVAAALVAAGVALETAETAARLASGRLDPARRPAGLAGAPGAATGQGGARARPGR